MPDHAVHDIVQLHTAHGIKPAPGGLHEAIVVEFLLVYKHRHASVSPGHQPLAVCHSDSHCIMVACGHTHVQLIATPTPGGVTQRLALHGCVSMRIHVLTFTRSLSGHQPLAVCHAELHGTVASISFTFTEMTTEAIAHDPMQRKSWPWTGPEKTEAEVQQMLIHRARLAQIER